MIKIFSIKEIIEATEKILGASDQKQNKNLALNKKLKKTTFDEKPFKKTLILEKELKNTNEFKNNKKLKINEEQNYKLIGVSENNSDRQEIVNELFKLFNRKIKKSTLKIIFEQHKEIKELRFNLSELRKKDYQNLRINKELKNMISDLVNNDKILNLKITQIQTKLDSSLKKESELKNINKNLEADLIEMKKSLTSIKKINIAIES